MDADLPTSLGRYRPTKVLGRGSMGVVYEGVDTRLDRTVAIKTVLRSFLADDATSADYAARFEREARAAARLNHPHIVTVFDFGEQDDMSYIVMELIRGRDLGQAFHDGERFTLDTSVRIIGELLDALAAAHAQGVVHRDVKPANVMLDEAGHVKLADFGVARLASGNQDRTVPGTQVGTPNYMAPEQVLGLPVGSRADIFATGVILYQLLTGRRPFAGSGAYGVQRAIVHDEPVPPSQLDAALPAGLDAVVARALAKQPEQRYETAADFALDLRRAMSAAGSAAGAAAGGEAAPTAPVKAAPGRRRLLLRWLGGGVALIWGTAAWMLLTRPAEVPPVPAVPVPAMPASAAVVKATPASAPVVTATPASAPVAAATSALPASALPGSAPLPAARPAPPVRQTVATPRPPAKERPAAPRGAEAKPSGNDPRCADLLTRMQLGDPLSPEQTTYFHTRCTRR